MVRAASMVEWRGAVGLCALPLSPLFKQRMTERSCWSEELDDWRAGIVVIGHRSMANLIRRPAQLEANGGACLST
jgi:hypothetical protein